MVAERLVEEGAALATRGEDVSALARLAHHVYGEHLARFDDGRACLSQLANHSHGHAAEALLRVLDASLAVASGDHEARMSFDKPTRIRITALAAGSVVTHDPSRAGALLREALAEAGATTLDDRDPACRALAITGNQVACSLEAKPSRSGDERALMILAAETGREYWARSGTWLELERAEYRLAQTWRHAGDFVEARRHAQRCLEIVREHDAPPLEDFFGWEALGLAERAAGNATGHAQALVKARQAFERLEEGDRKWCEPSLVALDGNPRTA
jgi:hypothetical protein